MKTLSAAAISAAIALSAASQASAVTVDFTGPADHTTVGNTYADLGVNFDGAAFFQCFGTCPEPNTNHGFIYADNDVFTFTAFFSALQSSVSFQGVGNSGTLAKAYNTAGDLIDSLTDNEGDSASNFVNTLSGDGIAKIVFSYDGFGDGPAITNLTFAASAAPEPSTWAMMILGFGMAGTALRRTFRRSKGYDAYGRPLAGA